MPLSKIKTNSVADEVFETQQSYSKRIYGC